MELEWVQAKIGDMWKGTGTNDPAAVKGRVPAINPTAIFNSCAAYKDGRIYLAVPTNSSTVANVVIVLDMATQQVWLYTYPFNITSLYLDRVGNRLMAGTDSGRLMQLETGLSDGGSGIVWSFTSREWSDATDKLIENLQAEVNGTGTWGVVVNGVPVGTSGTYVNAGKGWSPISLQGYTADNVKFTHVGTQSGTQCTVYAMEWDAIPQVKKVTYFQTDPIAPPSDTYVKSWLADLIIPTGGTATGTLYVDGTVIMSATMGPPATSYDIQGRYVYEIAPPNITYGKNISAVYTCSTLTLVGTNFVSAPTSFRHYNTNFEFEAKPYGKLAWLVTYKKAGGASQADMARYYAMDLEGMENGTVTNSWIIDGTLFSTDTLIFGSNSDAGENGVRVRNYMDRVPFPPGARGYLFQQEITSTQPFKVWRASLDFDRIGLKGLSRVTQNGSPVEGS
jgi:hypothetical protein